jgi:DNA-binding transcriptional LysR family regulator
MRLVLTSPALEDYRNFGIMAHIDAGKTTTTYLAQAGEPEHPRDLTRHECLVFGPQPGWQLYGPNEVYDSAVTGRFLLNSIGMLRQLAELGAGLAVLPREIITDDLSAGRMRRVLHGWHADPVPVYAVTETRLLPAKVQRFIEFLRERLAVRDSAGVTE